MKIQDATDFFDELQVVWKCDETRSRAFDIPSQSKLKLRRKLRAGEALGTRLIKYKGLCSSYLVTLATFARAPLPEVNS